MGSDPIYISDRLALFKTKLQLSLQYYFLKLNFIIKNSISETCLFRNPLFAMQMKISSKSIEFEELMITKFISCVFSAHHHVPRALLDNINPNSVRERFQISKGRFIREIRHLPKGGGV